MAILDEEMLRKHIKTETPAGAYLLFGEETYLKRMYAERLTALSVGEGMADFNLHRFEGGGALDDILQACEALPVMGECTCVTVRDLNVDTMGAQEFDTLCAAVADLPPTTVMLVWQDSLVFDQKTSSRCSKLIKVFEDCGHAARIKKRIGSALLKPLTAGAAKRGCTLDSVSANYLVSVVGDDFNTLLNELEKLCHFVGKGVITRQTIDEVCVKSLDATAFDLARALISNNSDRANRLLNTLFERRVKPQLIMGALIGVYVDMYRAKVALTNGKSAEFFAASFNYKGKEFRLKNAARDCSRLSVKSLRESLDILFKADLTIKTEYSDSMGSRLAIEKAMVRLMLAANTP